jgi:prepilin-type processing-associated H-X9-DG protein
MDENLLGYLLDALDPATHRQVETYLRDNPEGRRRLEQLRQALAPLAADRDTIGPPPGLVVRTIGRVAEHRCRPLEIPAAPPVLSARSSWTGRSRWRRPDVLVAAAVLFLAVSLVPSALIYVRRAHARLACANNLRELHHGLTTYADLHDGRFPQVASEGRHAVAGIVAPMLADAQCLPQALAVDCPAASDGTWRCWSLEEVDAMAPEEFRQVAPRLAGTYSYALGFRDEAGGLYGYTRSDNGGLPLMADMAPRDPNDISHGNSPNHGGGQNVLYIDGSVKFATNRYVGVNGDDIFLNRENRPEAGVEATDSSLGTSADHP